MHIVYKIIFVDRLKENNPPYFYIGSKLDCEVIDNIIFYKNSSRQYIGSSSYPNYKNIYHSQKEIKIEILREVNDPENILLYEKEEQLKYDVLYSNEYFNLSYATNSTYNKKGYAVYKHKDNYKKMIKLKPDDPLVLDGTYIHLMSGFKFTENNLNAQKEGFKRLQNNKERHDKFKQNISNALVEIWKNTDTTERVKNVKAAYTPEKRKIHSDTIKNVWKNLSEEEYAYRCKVASESRRNMSVDSKLRHKQKMSYSINNSEKFKSSMKLQKEKRKSGGNPASKLVFWDGLMFECIIDFLNYIEENKIMSKNKARHIVTKEQTDKRYTVKKKDFIQ